MDNTLNGRIPGDDEKLSTSMLLLNVKALGLVLGLLAGLGVFITTNWLVIKGGEPVGPHLILLAQYFIGYEVSFWGSIVGFAYGFAVGTMSGSLIAWIYNKISALNQ